MSNKRYLDPVEVGKLHRDGKTAAQIGSQLKYSSSSVREVLKKLGYTPNIIRRRYDNATKCTKDEFISVYNNLKFCSYTEIAKFLSISMTTLRKYRKFYKLGARFDNYRYLSGEETRRRNLAASKCKSVAELSEMLGTSYGVARKWALDHGIKYEYDSWGISSDEILKFYYDNRDLTWNEMADKLFDETPVKCRSTGKQLREKIGLALMKECKANPECPMLPLLNSTAPKKKKKKQEPPKKE